MIVVIFLIAFFGRQENFSDSDYRYIDLLKKKISLLDPNFVNLDIVPGYESSTYDKRKISLCIKDPNNSIYYDKDVLIYVLLHEIAHLKSKSYSTSSHNREFIDNFEKLLNEAYRKQLINPNLYVPSNYCKK